MSVLLFFLGLWIGGAVGVVVMCLLAMAKDGGDTVEPTENGK